MSDPRIDEDRDLRYDWRPELGCRAFEFDAFLSHNHGDGSARLARWLEERGVRVWHDDDTDVADRNVQLRLAHALRAARLVAVCVGSGFRASDWCRAEYLPALAAGRRAGATRVVVALLDPGARVPEPLRGCPVFGCDARGRRDLARALAAGNALPFDPRALAEAAAASAPDAADTGPFPDLDVPDDPEPFTDAWMARAAKLLGERTDEYRERWNDMLYVAAVTLEDPSGLREPLSNHTWARLRAAALAYLDTPERENRANALSILCSLAVDDPAGARFAEFLRACAREPDAGLLTGPVSRVFRSVAELPDAVSHAFAHAVLRAEPAYLSGSPPLLAALPEAVRLRAVLLHTRAEELLDTRQVGPEEQVSVLERRVRVLFADADRARDTRSASVIALENALFDLRLVLSGPDASARVLGGALRIFEFLVDAAAGQGGLLLRSRAFEPTEVLIHPLARLHADPALRARVREVYLRACEILRGHPTRSRAVPLYLAFFRAVEAGEDFDTAARRLTMDLLEVDHQARLEEL